MRPDRRRLGRIPPPLDFILKVVSRCNLSCSYCYVYNKGDDTWQRRPSIMPDQVFEAALRRIRHHCELSGQELIRITFHGGEPCLAGPSRFAAWCRRLREVLGGIARVQCAIQTNATLLDERWIQVIRDYGVEVGVSMDGPPAIHDAHRVDHRGRGSYALAVRGMTRLRAAAVPFGVLSVIPLGADGVKVHRHFVDLGVRWINYLLPQFTHDTIGPIHERFGCTPCADFLIPILDEWWTNGTMDVRIRVFWEMARLILGGESCIDMFGNRPFRFVFVEADGAIEGLDVLRVCENGMAATELNVVSHDFVDIAALSPLHGAAIFDGMPLPAACKGCSEEETCAGGYLSHRYSRARSFDNPSVWCDDLLAIFTHLRTLMGVSVPETGQRQRSVRIYSSRSPR